MKHIPAILLLAIVLGTTFLGYNALKGGGSVDVQVGPGKVRVIGPAGGVLKEAD